MQKPKFENLPNRLLLDSDDNFGAYVNAAQWLRQHLMAQWHQWHQQQANFDRLFEDYFNCKLIDHIMEFADFGPHYIEFTNEADLTLFLLKWKR